MESHIYFQKMKQSLLEKASLPSPQYKEYLINYFFLGSDKSSEPDNWNQTVESIQLNLGWNRSLDSFNKFVSQVFQNTLRAQLNPTYKDTSSP